MRKCRHPKKNRIDIIMGFGDLKAEYCKLCGAWKEIKNPYIKGGFGVFWHYPKYFKKVK